MFYGAILIARFSPKPMFTVAALHAPTLRITDGASNHT